MLLPPAIVQVFLMGTLHVKVTKITDKHDPLLHTLSFQLKYWQCLFCRQNADGNRLAGAIVSPVRSLAETK